MTGGESDANAQVPPPPDLPAPPPAQPSASPPGASGAGASGTGASGTGASGTGASRRPSRRAFLLGGGLAVVVGAGAGVGVEYWRDEPSAAPRRHAPPALRAALTAERDLIAALDASLPGAGTAAAALRQARADHLAHERALAAAVADAGGGPSTASSPSSATTSAASSAKPAPPAAQSVAQLRRAETDAARRAAKRAAVLSGRDAVLLASIAACEASHAELLS